MKAPALGFSLFLLVPSFTAAEQPPLQFAPAWENPFEWRSIDNRWIALQRSKKGPLLVSHQATDSHGRPYLHPLRSPDLKGVLTQFSPGHHKHQTGLYWGPTRINGRDYFHNYNEQFWAKTTVTPLMRNEGQPLAWSSVTNLLGADGGTVLRETQHWSIIDHAMWYTLDLHWTGEAHVDVTIGKYPYGGLFLRMPWKPGIRAECLNSAGDKNQDGEGKPARWVDLAMEIEGMDKMGRIAIIDHPSNPGYPNLWRIDGQFGIGPAISRRGDIKIPRGEKLHYRYRLVVYQGDFDRAKVDEETRNFGLLPRERDPGTLKAPSTGPDPPAGQPRAVPPPQRPPRP